MGKTDQRFKITDMESNDIHIRDSEIDSIVMVQLRKNAQNNDRTKSSEVEFVLYCDHCENMECEHVIYCLEEGSVVRKLRERGVRLHTAFL